MITFKKKKSIILNFHEINNSEWFERIILLIRDHYEYKFVDLEEACKYDELLNGEKVCHFTFDDGTNTFFNNAYPVLKKYNVPATVFICPSTVLSENNLWWQEVGDYDPGILVDIISEITGLPKNKINTITPDYVLKCLTLSQISKVMEEYKAKTRVEKKPHLNMDKEKIDTIIKSHLISIGGHTDNHPILKNENSAIAEKEITDSIKILEKTFGTKIKYFAYPNGIKNLDFNTREYEYLEKNDISYAVTTFQKNISKNDHKYCIPRIGMTDGDVFFLKLKIVLGSYWEKFRLLKPKNEQRIRSNIYSELKKIK